MPNDYFNLDPIDTDIVFNPIIKHPFDPLPNDKLLAIKKYIPANDFGISFPNPNLDFGLNDSLLTTDFSFSNTSSNVFTGQIVDDLGEPIPWATINSAQDTTIYVQADDNGNYSIEVPSSHNVTVSSVGFQPLTIAAEQLTSTIVLKMDSANELETVWLDPVKKTNYTPLIVAGVGLALVSVAIATSKSKSKLAGGKTCNNRAKCKGLNKNGTLKKGYRFIKGGKVVKTGKKARVVEATI